MDLMDETFLADSANASPKAYNVKVLCEISLHWAISKRQSPINRFFILIFATQILFASYPIYLSFWNSVHSELSFYSVILLILAQDFKQQLKERIGAYTARKRLFRPILRPIKHRLFVCL